MPSDQPKRTMSVEAFARIIEGSVSAEFFSPDRLAVMRQISQKLARDPETLKSIERMLGDHADDLRKLAPSDSEFVSFGWTRPDDESPQLAPVAAAAALAPGAAALAAGPCSLVGGGGADGGTSQDE